MEYYRKELNNISSLGVEQEMANKKVKSKAKVKIAELELIQTELAKEFEVAPQTFNGWITGRITPTLETALRLAKRFGCTVNDLYELKEE